MVVAVCLYGIAVAYRLAGEGEGFSQYPWCRCPVAAFCRGWPWNAM